MSHGKSQMGILRGWRFLDACLAKTKQRAGRAASLDTAALQLPLRPLLTLSLALILLR